MRVLLFLCAFACAAPASAATKADYDFFPGVGAYIVLEGQIEMTQGTEPGKIARISEEKRITSWDPVTDTFEIRETTKVGDRVWVSVDRQPGRDIETLRDWKDKVDGCWFHGGEKKQVEFPHGRKLKTCTHKSINEDDGRIEFTWMYAEVPFGIAGYEEFNYDENYVKRMKLFTYQWAQ